MRVVWPFPTLAAPTLSSANGATYVITPDSTGDGNRDIDLLGRAITIESQSGDPALCVLNCQGNPQEPHRGILFRSQKGRATAVRGITVRNAYAIQTGQSETWGAVMYCGPFAGPTISNCVLSHHAVGYVCGGLMCDSDASPLVEDCVFSDNIGFGAGIFVSGGDAIGPTVADRVFTGNVAPSGTRGGGGICFGGGRA